ncbi:alpha/beta hydrolase [Sporichthya sp.]|uniref:alpha/beta hydrolase n=1 Tax=Sporichthya sp. TaxID=65475 RepID=UPI0017A014D8|nr:alpha/beta hydrolase [Sporichthya sp.]MBA3741420.1 alpha/beta hydrolase [Sporichthya sp.]
MDVKLDPALVEALRAIREVLPDPRGDRFIEQLRRMAAAGRPDLESLRSGGRVLVDELAIPGPAAGTTLNVLWLRPARAQSSPVPAVYFLHPGGMIAGDSRTGAGILIDFVLRLGVQAVSVEYRLAPENPFPAPLEDAFAGLEWLARNATPLGVDATRIVVAGASAGGHLAAGLAMMARDRHTPAVRGLVLIAPMLDDRGGQAAPLDVGREGTWGVDANRVAWDAVLGNARGGSRLPDYAVPARADLAGLPPTFLDVGSAELFHDETVEFSAGLRRAGVPTELRVWPGGFHGFDWSVPGAPISLEAKSARVRWLAELLDLADEADEVRNEGTQN